MKKTLARSAGPLTSARARVTLRTRLGGALALVGLAAGLSLVSSRPAHTAGGPIAVTVANTPLAVAAAGGTPVEGYITVSDPTAYSFGNLLYTVPAGKRLVVDAVTVLPELIDATSGYTAVILHEDAVGNIISLSTLSTGAGSGAVSGTTQAFHIYARPGEKIVANVFKTGSGPTSAYVSLSGNLVDAP